MIEPTAEMRRAAYDAMPSEVRIAPAALDKVLAAVLAIVERDYRIEPRPPWERADFCKVVNGPCPGDANGVLCKQPCVRETWT